MTMSLPFRRPPPRSAVALGCWDRRVLGAFMCRVSLKPLLTWLPCATGLPFFSATCASLSPRRMVWGAVQNPTRTSGGPCEYMAGVPFGLRPMPFLASCVTHAEGGVGRGPHLSGAAVLCCSVVCWAGVLPFLLFCPACLLVCLVLSRSASAAALPVALPLPLLLCLFRCPGPLCFVVCL